MRGARYIETGEIVTVHGVKGEVKVYPWCDSAQELVGYRKFYLDANGEKEIVNEKTRIQNGMAIIKIKGIDSVEEAVKLRGKKIYVDRNDIILKEGQHLICDIVGCEVFDEDSGERYGEVTEVSSTGANDVYHIKFADGKVRLAPAIKQVVIRTDVEEGKIFIRPLRGLFDED